MISHTFNRWGFIYFSVLVGFFVLTGCASFLANAIRDTAGPSSPSQYFLSIYADPKELPYPAGHTEITVKVWNKAGNPVSNVPVNLSQKFPYAGWLHEDTVVTGDDGTAKTIFKDISAYGGSQYVEAKLENLRAMVYILFIPDGGPGVINN